MLVMMLVMLVVVVPAPKVERWTLPLPLSAAPYRLLLDVVENVL